MSDSPQPDPVPQPPFLSSQPELDPAALLAPSHITAAAHDAIDALLASLPFGIAVVDRDLRYRQINAPLAVLKGQSAGAHLGRALSEMFLNVAPQIEPILGQVLTTGEPAIGLSIVTPASTAAPSTNHWQASLYPIPGPDDAPVGAVLLVVDVAPLEQIDATLRQQAALLEHAQVLVRDPESRIVSWNQGAERLYGWTAEEVIGQVSHELFQTRFPTSFEDVQSQLFGAGRWEGELVHRRRDGGELVVASLQVLFRDQAGTATLILEVNNDITALRRTREALREREAQLQLALDVAGLGTWHYDIAADQLTLDARARAHYGIAGEELRLADLFARVHPEDRDRLAEIIQASAPSSDQNSYATEHRVVHPDGSVHWLAVNVLMHWAVEGAANQLTFRHGTSQDITAKKVDEAALQAHAEALSKANVELARALGLKDEFLAMMSHELRTPLTAVLGISEAMRETLYGPVTDEQRQALETISSSGRHLLGVLSDILDLAQLEAEVAQLEREPVDVELLCRSALQMVHRRAQDQGLRLLRIVAQGVEGLRADGRRLTQILLNLLDNAVKFTPPGGTVALEVEADPAREQIAFTVWDTGIGIGPEDMGRLFQPFTQVDGRLARAYGGIGVGLTLVRRLTELHGGSVQLTSTPGAGSRFTVTLPWQPADNTLPLPSATTAYKPAWSRLPRVVIADDYEPSLELYAAHLARQGCAVTTARTGIEAWERIVTLRPDVAVLNVKMPELDGLAVIRRVRADAALSGIPIIALTALAMPGDRERCLAAGATAYLAKPVSLSALLATIVEVVGLRDV